MIIQIVKAPMPSPWRPHGSTFGLDRVTKIVYKSAFSTMRVEHRSDAVVVGSVLCAIGRWSLRRTISCNEKMHCLEFAA
jgi:hypothetical protein